MTCKGECRGPGYYQKLITIEKLKTTETGATLNEAGHIDPTLDANWEQHTKAYAKVVTQGGSEFYRAAKTEAELTHLWMVPSSSKIREVVPAMRVKWNGRTFNILSAHDVNEERRESEIKTKEAV